MELGSCWHESSGDFLMQLEGGLYHGLRHLVLASRTGAIYIHIVISDLFVLLFSLILIVHMFIVSEVFQLYITYN